MSSEGDERMKPSSDMDYLSSDDAIEGNGGENDTLKKGPWTSAEDELLMKHVKEHGEGSWNAVKKLSGLARCGKSCRLRWMNHLRPELKKGAFTPEEERRIVELHAKMGNKWARMAVELPGRTDNEIKNYWNTRIKKRQRAGLPIYPDYICLESLNENLQSDDMNNISSGDVHQPDDMPNSNYEIPTVEFSRFEFNPHIYPPALLDFPASRFLDIPANRPLTYSYKSLHPHPTVHQSKRIHESESLSPPICSAFPTKNQYQSDESMQIDMSSAFSTYNHNLEYDHARSSSSNGSHAILNNHPFSEPAPAMKQELPSLQTQMGMWGSPSPSSPFPFSEFVDDPVPTPLNEQIEFYNVPQDTGLLDDVLYESRTMKNPISNGGFHQTPNVSSAAVHTMDNWEHVVQDREWRGYQDQLSPIGHSSSSFFSESTPISGNSFDDPFSAVNLPVVDESVYGDSVSCDAEVEAKKQMVWAKNQAVFSRPDFSLADSFDQVKHPTAYSNNGRGKR